jgi:hypothetical protein
MAGDLLRVALVSNLKLKSPLGVVFPFPFLEVMMVEGRKNKKRFFQKHKEKKF